MSALNAGTAAVRSFALATATLWCNCKCKHQPSIRINVDGKLLPIKGWLLLFAALVNFMMLDKTRSRHKVCRE